VGVNAFKATSTDSLASSLLKIDEQVAHEQVARLAAGQASRDQSRRRAPRWRRSRPRAATSS
jgi:methylmalonyl-CoA mutase N-terminal domain/subunit